MQATPVMLPMMFTTKNERIIKNKPSIENTIVFLACSIFFESPPEVTNLIPPIIIKITATDPLSIIPQKIKFAIKSGIQFIVATPLASMQVDQSIIFKY